MLLVQLWTDFLSYTRPVLSGGTLVVLLQVGLGTISPTLIILRAVKRENKRETFLLCMIPIILISACAIIQPLLFGSFLGRGFQNTDLLRAFLNQSAFFREVLILSGIFTVSAMLYVFIDCKNGRLSFLRVFFNIGLEGLFVLVVLVLGVDYFDREGKLLHMMSDTAIKWFVYGIYLLLYKSCLYGISLLWHLLFSQRQVAMDSGWPIDYEKWLRHYLTGGYQAIGWGLTMFAVFFTLITAGRGFLEEGWSVLAGELLLIGTLLFGIGIYCLMLSFFPMLMSSWRRMQTWGDQEEIAKQLSQELEKPLFKNDLAVVTEHFFVITWPKKMYYLPLLQSIETIGSGRIASWQLRFQDGSKCAWNLSNQGTAEILEQLQKIQAKSSGAC